MNKNSNQPLKASNVGGWLEGYGSQFQNVTDSIFIESFENISLDEERIAYFTEYMNTYFNDCFLFGQGTDGILQLLNRYQRGGDWLDVGAGTTTLFWSLAFGRATSVTCGDIVPEALKVLDDFLHSQRIPPCYTEAAAKVLGVNVNTLPARALPWRYVIFDAHQQWPRHVIGQFDTVTAFGCFGLARDPDSYIKALRCARPHLKPDGVLVGCDWSRSETFVQQEGLDNRYMSQEFIRLASRKAGFEVTEVKEFTISNDPLYDHVVGYALR
jgi:SAM-dependent methyltransferase